MQTKNLGVPPGGVWIDEHYEISFAGLVEQSGLSDAELHDLLDCGVLAPLQQPSHARTDWRFSAQCLVAVRTASRLRDDFDLDSNGMALALTLLERISVLEAQMRSLQAWAGREPPNG